MKNVDEKLTAENWQFGTYNFEKNARNNAQEVAENTNARVLEPLGSFESYDDEWKSMANIIMQDVGFQNNVHWNDVIGHNHAKELLKEAVVYPVKYHQLFSSLISPWKGILLYGPTGTGKTLLAAAAASDCQATFFKIGISTLLSKWRGESEKLMKVLFDLAKHHAPSIIFIDEIDALMSHRGCDHEASRRMKTEFFLHMDALSSDKKLVLVLAATNLPWELDYAILRRLEKRVFISPPNDEERMLLFKKFLPPSIEIAGHVKLKTSLDYNALTEATKNYAAADIEAACKEAKMNSVRQAFSALESESQMLLKGIVLHPLNTSDILQAINKTKPAASEFSQRYMEWKNEHGSE